MPPRVRAIQTGTPMRRSLCSSEGHIMSCNEDDMSMADVDTLCDAATAAYFAIVIAHATRTGQPALLPDLLCPRRCPPRIDDFTDAQLDAGERFLLRLGVIAERSHDEGGSGGQG